MTNRPLYTGLMFSEVNVKVELDLPNYEQVDLAILKSETGKLETTLVDVSKVSDAVKSEVVKKTEYNELV